MPKFKALVKKVDSGKSYADSRVVVTLVMEYDINKNVVHDLTDKSLEEDNMMEFEYPAKSRENAGK
jgi:hypothetical protein